MVTVGREIVKPKRVFGTYEWASSTANFIDGCKHDCKYCYSREMAIRFYRKTKENWKIEVVRPNYLRQNWGRFTGTVMFPSSHDIHPDNLDSSIEFLSLLLQKANRILIVSKPHLFSIREICKRFADQKGKMLFRFTIGSSSSKTLKFWEPGAPSFEERIESLKYAYKKGFSTSVSCEPMLDEYVDSVINKALPFITDAIWLGKMNFARRRLKINGYDDPETMIRAQELFEVQNQARIEALYTRYRSNKRIRWKDSIKMDVGIALLQEKGLDL